MNLTALLIACGGVAVVLLGFYGASKVRNKGVAVAIKIVGTLGGFMVTAAFPVKDLAISSEAGAYWFILLILATIASKFIFKA